MQNHRKAIIRLGTPIAVGQLGNIILGFIDTIMVGHYSPDALSAAGLVNNIFNLGLIALIGFSYGATPIIGALYGRKEHSSAGAAFKSSVMANSIFGVIIFILYTLLYVNLHNLGQPQELIPVMRPYFLTLLASIPFATLLNCLKQFTDTVAATKTAMWVIIAGNVTNIILNYLLIFGKFGMPEMGLTGAGAATLISRILMLTVFVLVIYRRKRFAAYREGFINSTTSRRDIAMQFRMGTPLALQMGMETASFSLASLLMGWLGSTQLAAFQMMCITGSLCFLIYYSIGAAASIQMSHHRGRNEWHDVKNTATAGLQIIILTAIVLSIGIILFKHELALLFKGNQAIRDMFITLLIPMLAYQISDGIQTNYANALRGIGVTKPLGIYAFISYICLALPASYLLGFTVGMGAIGVAYGLPIGLTAAAILYYRRFSKEIGKQLKKQ